MKRKKASATPTTSGVYSKIISPRLPEMIMPFGVPQRHAELGSPHGAHSNSKVPFVGLTTWKRFVLRTRVPTLFTSTQRTWLAWIWSFLPSSLSRPCARRGR